MIPPNTPWAAPKYFESFIKAPAFVKIKIYSWDVLCFAFASPWGCSHQSGQNTHGQVMFAGIQSLQGNLGVSHQLSWRWHVVTIPEGWAWRGPKQTSHVTVSTRHVNSRSDSDDARHVSLLCFYPQCLTFQSPLSTGRKMAASIKSLNLNFEKSKTIPNCHRPPYSPYLAPSLVVPPTSLPLIRSWLSLALSWGSNRSSSKSQCSLPLPLQAASPGILPDQLQFFKGKPLPKGGHIPCSWNSLLVSRVSEP